MARLVLQETQPLRGDWAATLTDVSIQGEALEAWFAIGRGEGHFFAYSPFRDKDRRASFAVEVRFERNGDSVRPTGDPVIKALDREASATDLLAQTGMSIQVLLQRLTSMLQSALLQPA